MIKKCIGDPVSIISIYVLRVDENLFYEEVPVEILDHKVKKLRNKEVAFVKFLRRNNPVEGATWEAEADIMYLYPHLFTLFLRLCEICMHFSCYHFYCFIVVLRKMMTL